MAANICPVHSNHTHPLFPLVLLGLDAAVDVLAPPAHRGAAGTKVRPETKHSTLSTAGCDRMPKSKHSSESPGTTTRA